MSGNEIAALLVAVGGVIGAVFTGVRGIRGDRFKRDVEASANILSGLNSLVKTLQDELERVKRDYQADREAWAEERRRMREEHNEEIRDLNERIDELATQLWALQHRPLETRERESDR